MAQNATELLADFDKGLNVAYDAVNKLKQIGVEDQSFSDLYDKLKQREQITSGMLESLKALVSNVGAECHHRWRVEERYYVYVSFRYDKVVEASIQSLGEASGSGWHDLHFAARHWKRMEETNNRAGRKTGEIHYAVMAYSPKTGRIRKVDQTEIDAALARGERSS